MYLLYVKVWTAHVCSVTNAVHIHVHTYISQHGWTAFVPCVCEGGDYSCLYCMLQMHIRNMHDGWTALHLAAQEGHEDVVELLPDPELTSYSL